MDAANTNGAWADGADTTDPVATPTFPVLIRSRARLMVLWAVIASYRPSPRTPPDYRRITGPTIGGFPHSRRPPVDRIGCTAQLPPDSAAQDQYCRDDSIFWETETGGSLETLVCTNQSRRSGCLHHALPFCPL